MPSIKADLLLHPVRLRIVTELMNRPMTPGQLAATLPDIAQATLYRQINTLQESGVIEVTEETPVKGAVERTYSLVTGSVNLSPEDMRGVSREEHAVYFNTFAASLMETFAHYINHVDLKTIGADGMSYNRAVIYLNAEERAAFQKAVTELIGQYMALPPTPDRNRFTLASIVIPDEREQPK